MSIVIEKFPTGDTIRAICSFYDFAPVGTVGVLDDPDFVSITTYNASEDPMINDDITIGGVIKDSLAVYHYDWILPLESGTYYIEFKGMFSTEPTIQRKKIKVKFDPNG